MTSFLDLRHLEPDQFHAMVKMHLSFLLDLNTDDCDCNHIYNCDSERANGVNGASTPAKSNTEAKRKRMQLLTPRRLLPSSDKVASSQVSSASDLRESYPNSEPTAFRVTSRISKSTMKFACFAYSTLNMVYNGRRKMSLVPACRKLPRKSLVLAVNFNFQV